MDRNKEIKDLFSLEETRMTTYTGKILSDISKIPGIKKKVGSWFVADGSVGLFRYEDGNAYEIEIRPISLGKHKELWGDMIKRREDR